MQQSISKEEFKLAKIFIPLLALITSMAISFDNNCWKEDFISDYFITFLCIISIWLTSRSVIYYFQKNYKEGFYRRVTPQILISATFAMCVVYIGTRFHVEYMVDKTWADFLAYDNFRLLLLVGLCFSLFINAIYEGLLVQEQLTASVIEAEQYKKASLEAQYQNLKTQVNPHFLFNSFNTLMTLIEESPDKASNFLQELSDVYRYVLTAQKKDWVTLEKELEFIDSFVYLLKMRFEENLNIDIKIEPSELRTGIPPLTLQMLVENAIKHNEITATAPLSIRIYTKGEELIVENNKQIRKTVINSTKIGLRNIQNRYQFLSSKRVIVQNEPKTFTVRLPLIAFG